MTKSEYIDPNGRRVTVEGDFGQGLRLWQSEVAVTTQLDGRVPDSYRTRTLTVTDAANHDDWLAEVAKATRVGEYSMLDGALEIWKPHEARSQGLGRWIGKYHAAMTYLPFGLWEDHSFALAYFSGLALTDSENGLRIAPHDPSSTATVLAITSVISGTGILEVLSPEVGHGSVPDWAGLKCPAGEVWKVEDPSDPEVSAHLVFCSATAVATASPGPRATLDDCLAFFMRTTRLDYERATS